MGIIAKFPGEGERYAVSRRSCVANCELECLAGYLCIISSLSNLIVGVRGGIGGEVADMNELLRPLAESPVLKRGTGASYN